MVSNASVPNESISNSAFELPHKCPHTAIRPPRVAVHRVSTATNVELELNRIGYLDNNYKPARLLLVVNKRAI